MLSFYVSKKMNVDGIDKIYVLMNWRRLGILVWVGVLN